MVNVPFQSSAFTADGTSGGVVTVASNVNFIVGATCSLTDNQSNNMTVVIVSKTGTTQMNVRNVNGKQPNYGSSDVSLFTVAHSSTIVQSAQVVYTRDQSYSGTSAAMAAGVILVASTDVRSDSRFELTHAATGTVGNFGHLYVDPTLINPGVSFTIKSSNGADTDKVFYKVINNDRNP